MDCLARWWGRAGRVCPLPLVTAPSPPSRPDPKPQLCTWLLRPLLLGRVDLDVLLKAEPAGGGTGRLAPARRPSSQSGAGGVRVWGRPCTWEVTPGAGGPRPRPRRAQPLTGPGRTSSPGRSTCCGSPCGSGGCSRWGRRRTGEPGGRTGSSGGWGPGEKSLGRSGWNLPPAPGKPDRVGTCRAPALRGRTRAALSSAWTAPGLPGSPGLMGPLLQLPRAPGTHCPGCPPPPPSCSL